MRLIRKRRGGKRLPLVLASVAVLAGLGIVGYSRLGDAWRWLHASGVAAAANGDFTVALSDLDKAALVARVGGTRGQLAETLVAMAECQRLDRNPTGSWDRAATLLAEAAALRERDGDLHGTASAWRDQAAFLQPDLNPGGDWAKAAALYERAADLFGRLGDRRAQRAAVHQQGFCATPSERNPTGDWARAAELFAAAVAIAREEGVPLAELAHSLHNLGTCQRRGPQPDLQAAAACFAEAADLRERIRDDQQRAASLRGLGECLVHERHPARDVERGCGQLLLAATLFEAHGDKLAEAQCLAHVAHWQAPARNPKGSWDVAISCHAKAAALYASLGDDAEQAKQRHWLASSLQFDRNPTGSWARAAAEYEAAAVLYARLGEVEKEARCLIDQAFCMAGGGISGMTSSSRFVMQRGMVLLRELGKKQDAAKWAAWVDDS